MASSGNTWFKKLRAKDKRNGVAFSRGTFKPLSLASTLDAPEPAMVKTRAVETCKTHNISSTLKRGRSGCRLNAKDRAVIAARREAREAFLAH